MNKSLNKRVYQYDIEIYWARHFFSMILIILIRILKQLHEDEILIHIVSKNDKTKSMEKVNKIKNLVNLSVASIMKSIQN